MSERLLFAITPTISDAAVAYASGDNIGGKLELERFPMKGAFFDKLTGTENTGQAPPFTVLFFNSDPTVTATDNAAFAWGAGSLAKYIGYFTVLATDWKLVGGKRILALNGMREHLKLKTDNTDRTLYAVMVADGVYDPGAIGDLTLTFEFEEDRPA
jgi:hypothetical protein